MVTIIRSTENQTYDQLQEQYTGYALCLVNCVYDGEGFFVTGQVFAYGPSVPEVMGEVYPLTEVEPEETFGQVAWKSFRIFEEDHEEVPILDTQPCVA